MSVVSLTQFVLSIEVKPNRDAAVESWLPKLEPEVVTARSDNVARFWTCGSGLGPSKDMASVNVDTQPSIDMAE